MPLALPPIVFSGYLRIRLEFKLEELNGKRFASSAALASEAVSAIRTVASLALERHILARYEDCLRYVARNGIRALVWTMFWYALTQSISFLAMALVCIISCIYIEQTQLTKHRVFGMAVASLALESTTPLNSSQFSSVLSFLERQPQGSFHTQPV